MGALTLAYVAAGPAGGLGAVSRWWLDRRIAPLFAGGRGWGIAVVNVIACVLYALAVTGLPHVVTDPATTKAWQVVALGFIGALSTFSTAVLDVATDVRGRRPGNALALLAGTLAACWIPLALIGWALGG